VITTVILVAVGIALAVAIGLWMSGLVATFTRFEKLEVTSAYATGSGTSGWNIYVTIKNTGSADATITSIMVNGVPIDGSTITSDPPVSSTQSQTLPVGGHIDFTLAISATSGSATWPPGSTSKLTSGVTVNIVFHSAAGKDYPTSVTLP